ncbi:3-methyl-2-oxobutanoate hydroxymethyltransferase (EC 2.1.2.11) [Methylomonas albis]|uniref:3-methyl-2-oxobutanoate hydroxymethyltransferase n=1 Tax=Methylomonas albis TaxID=1854563 RepID=A0ABR9CUX2_9GAMM|nr:3-methyl-2-oxobutanoate hydroxymethyltransferase [Methylomonas albis]MBD9354435.1 3-methyl-2-oxobutanoate hydroxymethyltransferase [Methylomonas albis]CAD6877311.1 3-methyl-2-oxobutanoate hydroxymethyltransferase (EC 2.1.2.11) [Methylomonas albis]
MSLYADGLKALTISDLAAMKRSGEKISCLTAYDASFSALLDRAGIDVLLIGDSLGMVIQGHSSTLPVTVGDMVYHSRNVAMARKRAFVITDLPFASYATPEQALANAASLMAVGGAQMVKLEGAKIDVIGFLVEQGIPVCGHLGLLPQSVNRLGGYKVQGREEQQARQIVADAEKIEQAGAGLLVLECVPAQLAAEISQRLSIPTIGIGAGVDCDGQVLVLYDMLNISTGKRPRFSKDFMADASSIEEAVRHYHQAVKSAQFPASEHSY